MSDERRSRVRGRGAESAGRSRATVGMTTDELALELGKQIRALRIFDEISQEELARLASVSIGTVANIENGKGGSLSTLIKILRPLGRIDWLFQLDNATSRGPSPLEVVAAERRRSRIRQRAAKKAR